MPPRAQKKPDEERPRRPRGLRLEPDGRSYKGAVVRRVVRTGQRVAVFKRGYDPEGEPDHIGVLIGLLCPRDDIPRLVVAVNDDTVELPVDEFGWMCPLPANSNSHAEVGI